MGGPAGEGPEAVDMEMRIPRMLKASGSYRGHGVRSGRKIMKHKVGRAGVASTAKKMNVWDPRIASAGFFSLFPLCGGPLDHMSFWFACELPMDLLCILFI